MAHLMKTRTKMSRYIALLLGSIMLCTALYAAEGKTDSSAWKGEFERICSQTKVATSLEPEELQLLISDSEKLLGELKESEDPGAKIYVFRLEKCKVFFEYAYELLEN